MKSFYIIHFLVATLFLGACHNQLTPNKKGNKYGYTNRSNTWVIKKQYVQANPFSQGLARVGFYTQRIDSFWIEPVFEDQGHWNVDTLLLVRYSFINSKNEMFPLKLKDAKNYNQGLAAAKLNTKWGYLNKKGEWQIDPIYAKAATFEKGKAKVIKESEDGKTWYNLQINKKGKVLKDDAIGIRKPDWFDSIPDWHTLMASAHIYVRLTDYQSAYDYYGAAARRINQIESEDTMAFVKLCQNMAHLAAMRIEDATFEKYDALASKIMEEVLASEHTERRRMIILKHIEYLFNVSEIREVNLQKQQEIDTLKRILDIVKRSETEDIDLFWDIEERLENLESD
ncbi:MAG: WG repeat-containing protein [Bacteroidia bacterium]